MIQRGNGLNDSERYLGLLCQKTFLSLWSYSNLFRQAGSELCDLLVICGNDIVIFSDKLCNYPCTGNEDLDWKRWFKRAVVKSAKQLWGAEKWIKNRSERIYVDSKCQHKLPIPLELNENTQFHLVMVAHGTSEACKSKFGGSGSMIFHNSIVGFESHQEPFKIGDLEKSQTFIHVLDDTTLEILLQNRDTIRDFTNYLIKREKFLRSNFMVYAPGEEELLAHYLKEINEEGEHDFFFEERNSFSGIALNEGSWFDFEDHPKRIAQKKADEISYMWDSLIEQFSKHAIAGSQYFVTEGGFADSEKAIRMLALETRFSRRVLATNLKEIIIKTPKNLRMLRVYPMLQENIYYVFLLLPYPSHIKGINYDKYRVARRNFLEASCLITRLMNPNAKHVVGIAFESGIHPHAYSEDLLYFDCDNWNIELERLARVDQQRLGILVKPTYFERTEQEYPD